MEIYKLYVFILLFVYLEVIMYEFYIYNYRNNINFDLYDSKIYVYLNI